MVGFLYWRGGRDVNSSIWTYWGTESNR